MDKATTGWHTQVKADEQAAKAAADYAQAQAEAQAELHRQLQQRLADAQAAAAAQEAEKEKRRVQPVTLKGARLAFNAPKGPAKPAATPPAGRRMLQQTLELVPLIVYLKLSMCSQGEHSAQQPGTHSWIFAMPMQPGACQNWIWVKVLT